MPSCLSHSRCLTAVNVCTVRHASRPDVVRQCLAVLLKLSLAPSSRVALLRSGTAVAGLLQRVPYDATIAQRALGFLLALAAAGRRRTRLRLSPQAQALVGLSPSHLISPITNSSHDELCMSVPGVSPLQVRTRSQWRTRSPQLFMISYSPHTSRSVGAVDFKFECR